MSYLTVTSLLNHRWMLFASHVLFDFVIFGLLDLPKTVAILTANALVNNRLDYCDLL